MTASDDESALVQRLESIFDEELAPIPDRDFDVTERHRTAVTTAGTGGVDGRGTKG